VEAQVQSDLNGVARWMGSSRLCLNAVKSTAMLIGSRQRVSSKTFSVSIGGTDLKQVNSVRYLGVIVLASILVNCLLKQHSSHL